METVQSAVRLPTPEPFDAPPQPSIPRKRSPPSRSPSPRRRPVPHEDRDGAQQHRRYEHRQKSRLDYPADSHSLPPKEPTAQEKQAAAKKEYEALLNKRSGGVYIPPARLRELQQQITDQKSKEYQRMAWEALKKSINGLINKVNIANIKFIVPELFSENLVRGRGLFCRSIMKAQAASLPFTPIFAATVAIVNTKLPQLGMLLVKRLVVSFRKAFRRNDKSVCISTTTFLAHLVNQQVCNEMLAAQILLLLLNKPTDDSVEIAVNLIKECGQLLEDMSPPIALAIFDQFRNILHEATDLEKRTQYMIEVLFQVRKDKWKDYPAVKDELDLVEEEDQIIHQISLDDDMQVDEGLNVFKFDPDYQANEDSYRQLKAEILGEVSGSEDEDDDRDGASEASSDDDDSDDEDDQQREMEIKDQTNTDLVNLRRSIYLTIKSSGTFEEACHKLMSINLPAGKESELPSMIIETSMEQRTFEKFYGNIGERFCKINRLWRELFEEQFVKYYETIHRYDANKLRIAAQFFGHLLSNDAISWQLLSIIHLNEDETTSSSRIFIKILFEEMVAAMGMPKLSQTLADDALLPSLDGIFPRDNPTNTRFSINFFTAIGLGTLTEGMREHLKSIPVPSQPTLAAPESDTESASSYSSYSSRSRSRTASRTASRSRSASRHRRAESRSRSPFRARARSPSHSRSGSRPNRRRPSVSDSASPRPRRSRRDQSASLSPSRSPSAQPSRSRRGRAYSDSLSPPRRSTRRSSTYTESNSRSPPRRSNAAYRERSHSSPRSPRYRRAEGENVRRRRNTSSEDSRSPPPRGRR